MRVPVVEVEEGEGHLEAVYRALFEVCDVKEPEQECQLLHMVPPVALYRADKSVVLVYVLYARNAPTGPPTEVEEPSSHPHPSSPRPWD